MIVLYDKHYASHTKCRFLCNYYVFIRLHYFKYTFPGKQKRQACYTSCVWHRRVLSGVVFE